MRDLNHPDMQLAIEAFSDDSHPFTKARWFNQTDKVFFRVVIHHPERGSFTLTFNRAERDLIVAHLKVLGF